MTREWKTACDFGNCVQVSIGASDADPDVLVTDSKNPDGTVLRFTRSEWAEFIAGVRDGEFNVEEGT